MISYGIKKERQEKRMTKVWLQVSHARLNTNTLVYYQVNSVTHLYLIEGHPEVINEDTIQSGVFIAKGIYDSSDNPIKSAVSLHEGVNRAFLNAMRNFHTARYPMYDFLQQPILSSGYSISEGVAINQSTVMRLMRNRIGNNITTRVLFQPEYTGQTDKMSLIQNKMVLAGFLLHTWEGNNYDIWNLVHTIFTDIADLIHRHSEWKLDVYDTEIDIPLAQGEM